MRMPKSIETSHAEKGDDGTQGYSCENKFLYIGGQMMTRNSWLLLKVNMILQSNGEKSDKRLKGDCILVIKCNMNLSGSQLLQACWKKLTHGEAN